MNTQPTTNTFKVGQIIPGENCYLIVTQVKQEAKKESPAAVESVSLGHLTELAYRAHTGTSFSPQERATSTIRDYEADLRSFLASIPDQHRTWAKEKYIRLFTSWLSAKGRCISSMITGPSNFPTKRAQKYNNWERGHYQEFSQWRDNIVNKLNRQERRKLTLDDEYVETENMIETLKQKQELMREANKVMRSKKLTKEEIIEELENLGITPADTAKMLAGDYVGRTGFRAFELTNNNGRIKHYEEKLAQLEKRINARQEETKELLFNGGHIVENTEADRLQIFFDGIPAPEIRNELKSNGFKWTPSQGCWQTFLRNGKYKLSRMEFLKKAQTDDVQK